MINSVVYATGQQIHIDPYNGKLFDFNSKQSRVYLGRSINQLLNVFGDNCIIDGLKIVSVELENNRLMINISPGKVIIDTTLIEFPNYTLLESDISIVDAFSGFFVVSIGFNYLHDNYENKAKFTLAFVNHAGQSTDFYTELEKIVLTKIYVNKEKSTANYTYSYYTNSEVVTINNRSYKIFPPDNITKNLIRSIQEIFFI
jgi:hypothetical protein